MSDRFTKGPWRAVPWGDDVPPQVFALDHSQICATFRDADATLISQAPAMLEALRNLVADLADYPAYERPCLALDKAREVIAKATGEDK